MSTKSDKHNTSWTVTIKNPLVRTGVELESGPVSEDYVVATVRKGIEFARDVNEKENNYDSSRSN